MTPELNLSYVNAEKIGYGRMGVKMAAALETLGVDVVHGQPRPDGGEGFRVCRTTCWMSTPAHAKGWYSGQRPILLTMFEATHLPEPFRESLHCFAQIIVPSHQNVELFSEYHDNVAYLPLGIDPTEWFYVPRTPPERYFRFLIGGSGERKGTDLAHAAFRKVFGEGMWAGSGPEPVLVMKNPRGEDFYGERVEITIGRVSAEEEQAIYASAHCYLQPSRGEGFGLQPLQAIAQGIPTILTNAHGHETFAHLGYGLSTTMVPAGPFMDGDAGEWWEPSFDELCEYMDYVYNNWEAAAALAEVNAKHVADTFTWENSARRFVDLVGLEHLTGPVTDAGEWVERDKARYLARVQRPIHFEIAGVHYQMVPGADYRVPAEVKRVLYGHYGILDPSCVDIDNPGDTGMTLADLAKFPAYLAEHSHCQTCGQVLNTRPTRADEILERLEAEAAQR